MLSKLNHYSVPGVANKLFESYLRDRKQYVYFEGIKSDLQCINKGVPQGSVLGPLLFLIYINDLAHSTSIFDVIMYADDTTLEFG